MMYHLDFSNNATKTLKKYKKSNPIAFKKLTRLLKELQVHPRTGTGHPELYNQAALSELVQTIA